MELTCINCPIGCRLVAQKTDGQIAVEGNECNLGVKYAISELTDPKRTVTALMKVSGHKEPLCVKTSESIRKALIFECLAVIKSTVLAAPVKIGDIVIKNICESAVDVVATKNIG